MLDRTVRKLKMLNRCQRGITGLETAIILIAFVVVASVFAYTVLSAGIFSAETGKEAVHAGLETARSSMALSGGVVARDTDADNQIEEVIFTLTTTLDGESADLTITVDSNADGVLSDEASPSHVLVITYMDKNQRLEDVAWTQAQVGKSDGDDLLESGEKFEITVQLTGLSTPLGADDRFTLEIRPEKGSSMIIERTIPAKVDPVMNLN